MLNAELSYLNHPGIDAEDRESTSSVFIVSQFELKTNRNCGTLINYERIKVTSCDYDLLRRRRRCQVDF